MQLPSSMGSASGDDVGKALLASILIALIAIPLLAASDPNPRRGMKRALFGLLVFHLAYVALLLLVWAPRNVPDMP
jgi:hypothetical protein